MHYTNMQLFHSTQILRNLKFGIGLLLNLLDLDIRGQFRQSKYTLLPIDLEHALRMISKYAFRLSILDIKLTKSVIIVETHRAPVNGSVQFCTIFATPYLST